MDFQATPANVTAMLIVALAMVAIVLILRKQYESNLPLMFYFVAVVFTNLADRAISPLLLYVGLVFALLLRFEFMNQGFARVIAFFATGSMVLIIVAFLAEVFGTELTLF